MSINQNSRESIAKIKNAYHSLPRSEKKVADFILNQPEEIIYLSVSELAKNCQVSDSTIIRFCKDVGFNGYQEFKLMLAQDLVIPVENINETITVDDNLKTIISKLAYINKKAIEETMDILNISELDHAINSIINARKIEFYGVGASGITAFDAKYKFLRIGLLCDAYNDSHLQAMSAATLTENDVVIGISHSGSTKDIVDSCKIAKKSGAKVICITGHMRSPITNESDIVLISATHELPLGSGALRSKIAQLYLLDLLFTGVALKLHNQTMKFTKKTARAVLSKLY